MVNLMFVQSSKKENVYIVNLCNVSSARKFGKNIEFYLVSNPDDYVQWAYPTQKGCDEDYNRIMHKIGLMSGSVAGD